MALDWPQLDELKQVLDVESNDWDGTIDDYGNGPTRLERLREAAIARVKLDVGDWDEYTDFPDDNLSQAALRMAELMASRPPKVSIAQLAVDPAYLTYLFGHRRKFGIA